MGIQNALNAIFLPKFLWEVADFLPHWQVVVCLRRLAPQNLSLSEEKIYANVYYTFHCEKS
jgi:hypothetical protein